MCYNCSTSQLGLAPFQVLSSHTWLISCVAQLSHTSHCSNRHVSQLSLPPPSPPPSSPPHSSHRHPVIPMTGLSLCGHFWSLESFFLLTCNLTPWNIFMFGPVPPLGAILFLFCDPAFQKVRVSWVNRFSSIPLVLSVISQGQGFGRLLHSVLCFECALYFCVLGTNEPDIPREAWPIQIGLTFPSI